MLILVVYYILRFNHWYIVNSTEKRTYQFSYSALWSRIVISDLIELRRALRRGAYRGVILYEGASMLDGMPVVAIANRITDKSTNGKTGAMVQTWIIRSDVNPVEALENGSDASVCG